MRMVANKYLLFLLLFAFTVSLSARNLGVVGQTYPIMEQDFLLWIQQRLLSMQSQGQLKTLQQQWIKKAQEQVDRPLPVNNMTPATIERQWLWDPSVVLLSDIRDANGKTLIAAGTTVNPLQTVSLKQPLVFYNADDSQQVRWVQKFDALHQKQTKLILVKGSLSTQVSLFQRPIYFDQQGRLVNRFHIQHVPAVAIQEGLKLRIHEILL